MSAHPHVPKPFPTTHWSELERIGQSGDESIGKHLDRLLSVYMPPLKEFLVRGRGYSPDEADDVLQGFVVDRIIQGRLIAKADQERGKFRTLLIAALKNYAFNVRRRERRGGEVTPLASDRLETVCASDDPCGIFEIAWAKQLVSDALRQMEQYCCQSKRTDIWDVFYMQVVQPIYNNTQRPSYKDIVHRFRCESPTQACNIVITGKRIFSRILRELIQDYVRDSSLVEEEFQDLRRIIAAMRA